MKENKTKKPIHKRAWFIALMIIIVIITISTCAGSDNQSNIPTQSSNTVEEQVKEDVVKKEEIPTEYKSALTKANIYVNKMFMSKAGLYDQLVSDAGEQFTPEAAQYAIDNVKADWKANALEKAKVYQEKMAMSPTAIYDQLTSAYGEQFTEEEAQYAIDNL